MPRLSLPAKGPDGLLTHSPTPALALTPGVDVAGLVGVPHLLGRVLDTCASFRVVPVGPLTLQLDGRLTGCCHFEAGRWVRGPLGPDPAFTLLPTQHSPFPRSTWQQTLGGMPLGCSDDELSARQRLCLIPPPAARPAPRLAYLVAACRRSLAQAVPRLLAQLRAEGIGPGQLKVVVLGCDRNEDREIGGVSYAFSTHRAGVCTALYEAPLRWQFDYGVLLPAASELPPGFRHQVERFNTFLPWDYLPAAGALGLYSRDFLSRLNPWLELLDGLTPHNELLAEATVELLRHARTALVTGGE
ncbi:hypothetical protein HHL22_01395 [Hymenobacter sp. RP-2-7]|uniref:Uncharacterized protein n=1 Tax=Hymenobacter polaris TaxID=2682546 RepID=A0A7Y0AAL6_9BACT|nr:hypothetical protein [Hymenobacter polaris]NML63849.1 hypothetical protein [Hymenobacter polaris]